MASTDIQSLADAEYARLTETRMERALADARRINPLAQPLLYDPVTGPCYRLLKEFDYHAANKAAHRQWDAICDARTKLNNEASADAKLDAARKAQPRAWAA